MVIKYIIFSCLIFLINIECKDNEWIFNNWSNNLDKINTLYKKWNIQGSKKIRYGIENLDFIKNPNNDTEIVMKITYPFGSYIPSNKDNIGGIGFYAKPLDIPKNNKIIISFQYDVYFQDNFIWNKGGKLPGLYGGHTSCSGGINPSNEKCFSIRYMWRENGEGEVYGYLPKNQDETFCNNIVMGCNGTGYGYSIDRGKFKFSHKKWYTLKQEIKLNTKNNNGYIKVFFGEKNNIKPVINENKVNFKTIENIFVIGIQFETFFGGGDVTYASPKNQYTLYKDFKLMYYKNTEYK